MKPKLLSKKWGELRRRHVNTEDLGDKHESLLWDELYEAFVERLEYEYILSRRPSHAEEELLLNACRVMRQALLVISADRANPASSFAKRAIMEADGTSQNINRLMYD